MNSLALFDLMTPEMSGSQSVWQGQPNHGLPLVERCTLAEFWGNLVCEMINTYLYHGHLVNNQSGL